MKLVKINTDHYVVVDDSKIEVGDWVCTNGGGIRHITKLNHDEKGTFTDDGLLSKKDASELCYICNYKKITHSTKPLEIIKGIGENSSINYYYGTDQLFLQEVRELIGEVDVMTKAVRDIEGTSWDEDAKPSFLSGYLRGYRQALEDNKEKKYTEEDLGLFLEYVRDNYTGMGAPHLVHNKGGQRKTKAIVQDYIQSLQPKTEWEVEIVDGKLKLKL